MFFDDFVCNVKILSVLKISWEQSDAVAHPRQYHALSFRTKGNATYTWNSNCLHIHSGEILFVPKDLGYHIQGIDEELYVIHFELTEKNQDMLELFQVADTSKIQRLFSNCYDVWNKKESGYYFKALSIFYNILHAITVSSSEKLNDPSYLELKPAIDYLHSHFSDTSCSVLTLCHLVGMSDTWFRKLFLKQFNTTPIKYINALRIGYAKELIESGYYKIEQISEMAGFGDSKYFSTTFKQYAGCSPSDYKKSL